MYRTDFWTLWEKARVGCFKRTTSKHVYYLGWNRSPAQAGCMRQVLGPGALGRPRGIGWRGRWQGGLGWGTHVNPWLIHVNVWQNPLQYCKVISLQLIKKIKKKKRRKGKAFISLEQTLLFGVCEGMINTMAISQIMICTPQAVPYSNVLNDKRKKKSTQFSLGKGSNIRML